ncbi:putative Mannosyltransferase [Nakaseomyces glabratus]|nr:putative Mannosyltransferase [Nakaseomyces glabratus]
MPLKLRFISMILQLRRLVGAKVNTRHRLYLIPLVAVLLFFVNWPRSTTLPVVSIYEGEYPFNEDLLHSSAESAFTVISDKINNLKDEYANRSLKQKLFSFFDKDEKILKNWESSSLNDKCRWLVRGIYSSSAWNNFDITKNYKFETAYEKFQAVSERVRIYNYCFMNGNIDPVEVFDELNIPFADPYDFQSRMFMFLKKVNRNDKAYMYPLIKNVRNGDIIAKPRTKMSAKEYNANFMGHWKAEARGRGITLTVAPDDIKLLRSLFKVLEKLGNEYPVEVVHKGGEMTPKMEDLIRQYAEETSQEVYVINLSPILDPDFASQNIKSFKNKWFAAMFNTFEEAILLDVDVVLYASPEYFFELDGYKKTGLMLWKDREYTEVETSDRCASMAPYFEPSEEEHELLGTIQKYRLTGPDLGTHNESEATTLNDFFNNKLATIIDSGVVLINKKQKLNALLLAAYYHMSKYFGGCTYGDKELFEIAALAAGEDYYVDPNKAGAIGPIGYHPPREKYYVCSAQMGHPDENNNLLWSNGGLKNCKLDSAEADFKKLPKYFKAKYGSLDTVKLYYKGRSEIQGFIVPDIVKQKWIQYPDCQHYLYCAFITDPPEDDNTGKLVRFSEEEMEKYNEIGRAWYAGTIY